MEICKYTHQSPPQNTPFPGLNLKVGKINYWLGNLDPNWTKCLKSGQNISRSGQKINCSCHNRLKLSLPSRHSAIQVFLWSWSLHRIWALCFRSLSSASSSPRTEQNPVPRAPVPGGLADHPNFLWYMSLAENNAGPWFELTVFGEL